MYFATPSPNPKTMMKLFISWLASVLKNKTSKNNN